ncbi:MFS transporter [Streptomyces sp. DT2A-34]|uniref:MFS transporter n=1 Tax=Streptomyces sp. DT2A-34 TaxID=3051182 RepID=UPI00265B98F9|nr:MFS transporter [Streptomyces sp. DT2A-34]MDO0917756.1 MFS transporter [Streptomyces sp. DT2A-34]
MPRSPENSGSTTGLQASPPRPLTAEPSFLYFLVARTVSVFGNGLARVALAFGVLSLPGSTPGQLSLVLACQAIPQVCFILIGGVVADRVRRSRLILAAEYTAGIAFTFLAVLITAESAPLVLLCFLAAVAGTASALLYPAMDGLIPQLVPEDSLQRANSALRTGSNTANLVGLAAAGAIVGFFGAGWALALNALTFFASGLLMHKVPVAPRPRRATSGWQDLREGQREFMSRQWLWVLTAQYALVMAAVNATVGVLGPLRFQDSGGAQTWSALVGAQAVGSIVGAALGARFRPRRPLLIASLAALPAALPMALLAARAPAWLTIAAMFFTGLSISVYGVLWSTTLQHKIPEESLSRVSSYDWFGSLSLASLGLLVAGPAAEATSLATTLTVCSLSVVLATALSISFPQVRTLPPGRDHERPRRNP